MDHATRRRIAETTVEDLVRLANQAERKGSRILHIDGTSGHVATSASSPVCYQVSVAGCTCRGFATWGRCGHWALLLSELGQLPDLADVVVDEQPAPCRACRGEGWIRMSTGAGLADWVAVECACRAGSRAIAPAA